MRRQTATASLRAGVALAAIALTVAVTAISLQPRSVRPAASSRSCSVSVYFSPRGGCTEAIVRTLDASRKSVLVQAYSFTSKPIAAALLRAHKRRVKVSVILDSSQRSERYSSADFLANSGIPAWIDSVHAIAHNKVIVVDGDIVIAGSFNFTRAAKEKNAENVLVIRDKGIAAAYSKNWERHRVHSEAYRGGR